VAGAVLLALFLLGTYQDHQNTIGRTGAKIVVDAKMHPIFNILATLGLRTSIDRMPKYHAKKSDPGMQRRPAVKSQSGM